MRHWRKILAGLAGGLVLTASARTAAAGATNQPYASIVLRNVFGLNPPMAGNAAAMPDKPPPKITLNGIMTIFGQLQALFKVSGAEHPGPPAHEACYILNERQSQDDIAVMHIDAEAGVVTFNNHGVVQDLSLANPNPPAIKAPILTMKNAEATPTVPKTYPPEFARSRMPDYLGGGSNTDPTDKLIPNTSLEQRIIMIEAQRAYLKSQHDPAADLLPPTAMTPPADESPGED
jgi:hypothetical protein